MTKRQISSRMYLANGRRPRGLKCPGTGRSDHGRDQADGLIHITLEVAQECIQKRAVRYDKDGDNHYDTISAFIKSMRGSDPDAAVYYLARMLYAERTSSLLPDGS